MTGSDPIGRVEIPSLAQNFSLSLKDNGPVKFRRADPPGDQFRELFGRNDLPDSSAADSGDGDADQSPLTIDHRSAAVAGVHVDVKLDVVESATVVATKGGDGAGTHRDGRIASASFQQF